MEVEAIGRVRHKNLVRLLGYCVEGAYRYISSAKSQTLFFLELCAKPTDFFIYCSSRMLVYEYVDNGNLDQWLHGDVGDVSPLTWDFRMNIILGTAKGCLPLSDKF